MQTKAYLDGKTLPINDNIIDINIIVSPVFIG